MKFQWWRAELGIPVLRRFGTDSLNYYPILPLQGTRKIFIEILGALNCSENVPVDINDTNDWYDLQTYYHY